MGKIKRVTPQKESDITASERLTVNSTTQQLINISSTNHTKMLSLLDCFAGAGGSSWGAVETRKISVKMAINHDATAIATHQENLPSVNHDIADVFHVNPKRYPKTDLAWFSPCCEGFTHASGLKNPDTTSYQPELFDTLEYKLLSQKAKEEYRHKQILRRQKRLTVEEVYKFKEINL